MNEQKKKKLCYFLASGLGAGFLPKSPGTFGTLSAMLFYSLLIFIFNMKFHHGQYIIYILCLYSIIVGTYLSNKILTFQENKDLKDPQFIVIDEWAGYFITILFASSFSEVCVGFVFFRIFDIWKPWLVGKAENLKGGYGIMADDIVAGLFSLFFMCLIFRNLFF